MADRKPVIGSRALRAAVLGRNDRRIRTEGELSLPAAPALLDLYLERLSSMFASMGKAFSKGELAHLRGLLEPRLREGFDQSPHSRVHVRWESETPPATGVDYRVWLRHRSVEEEYEEWASTRQPPLFGLRPDAKILELARALTHPARRRILDVGAGTGRNTLPLARAGYPTDALEITEAFCKTIEEAATAEDLPVEVVRGNVLAPDLQLGRKKYALVVCTEVTSHFRGNSDLRTLFERAAKWTERSGSFLLNLFVAVDGHEPDALARELSQIAWSTVFTRRDLRAVTRGLPFSLVSDERVHAYEKEHQPPEGWPPTGWFEDWSRGFNCYGVKTGLPPMELRWLHYRRR